MTHSAGQKGYELSTSLPPSPENVSCCKRWNREKEIWGRVREKDLITIGRMAGFRVHVRRQPWDYPAEGSSRERNCRCKSKQQRRAWVYNPLAKSWNPKTFDDKSRTFSLPSSTSRPDFLAKPLYGTASRFLSSNYEPWLALPHPLQSTHVPQGCQVPGPYQLCYCWSSGEALILLESSHS